MLRSRKGNDCYYVFAASNPWLLISTLYPLSVLQLYDLLPNHSMTFFKSVLICLSVLRLMSFFAMYCVVSPHKRRWLSGHQLDMKVKSGRNLQFLNRAAFNLIPSPFNLSPYPLRRCDTKAAAEACLSWSKRSAPSQERINPVTSGCKTRCARSVRGSDFPVGAC